MTAAEIYKTLGVSGEVLVYGEKILETLRPRFAEIDARAEINQAKVLAAMQKNRVNATHFAASTGYGYDDEGRDNLERVYADAFHTEAALVRPQITCGTHALAVALSANLLPGDELLAISGKPYEQMTYPGQRVQIDVKVVPRSCCPAGQRFFQYTAIDEFSRLRYLAAYDEQSTYSSADFLKKAYTFFKRHGFTVECVQTDNGFEFTNRFAQSNRELITLFEKTAAELGIRHKLIRPYTPRHNGKVERSHREDQRRFYDSHRFYSLADFDAQLAVHRRASNNRPMRPLQYCSPNLFLRCYTVQHV